MLCISLIVRNIIREYIPLKPASARIMAWWFFTSRAPCSCRHAGDAALVIAIFLDEIRDTAGDAGDCVRQCGRSFTTVSQGSVPVQFANKFTSVNNREKHR